MDDTSTTQQQDNHPSPRRTTRSSKRRRAVRVCDTPDYDRSADAAEFHSAFAQGTDDARAVPVDDDAAPGDDTELSESEFWRSQRPPHYS